MYSVDNKDRVVELKDVPPSSAGAPCPLVLSDERRTLLAYLVREKPYVFDGRVLTDEDVANFVRPIALIEFHGCQSQMFGAPNDEAFRGHPLSSRGLSPYGAYQVENSSWIRQLERMNSVHSAHRPESFQGLKHFIFAFHDSTFECVADGLTASEYKKGFQEVLDEMHRRLRS